MEAIYGRQSLDKKDSISIESQIELCRKELTQSTPKIYIDKGYSGKNTNRPGFERLVRDIEAGAVSRVIVYKLDRISRSVLDFAGIIELFTQHGIEFVSTTEKFDTSTPIGKAMLSIVMVFAQLERETIQQRTADNYYARGRQGMYIGGRAPYGFRKVPASINGKKTSALEPVAEQAEAVRMMYRLYAQPGVSLGDVSRQLNNSAVPAAQGGKWDSCKVSRTLNNPVYVQADVDIYTYYRQRGCVVSNEVDEFRGENGCYLYGKRTASDRKYTNIENHTLSLAPHRGIIDSRTFLQCMQKLGGNRKLKNTGGSRHTWLSGLLRCGRCGSHLSVRSSYRGRHYLSCNGKTLRQQCVGQERPMVASQLEELVEREILHICVSGAEIPIAGEEQGLQAGSCAKEIRLVEVKIDNLLEQVALGNQTVTSYINRKIEELQAQKLRLLEAQQSSRKQQRVQVFRLCEIQRAWPGLSFDRKKAVAALMIREVRVSDTELQIEWRYPFPEAGAGLCILDATGTASTTKTPPPTRCSGVL